MSKSCSTFKRRGIKNEDAAAACDDDEDPRADDAEKMGRLSAAVADRDQDRTVAALDHKTENTALPGPSTSNASVPSEDKYDSMYFDDEEEEERRAKSRKKLTDDDLFYDPDADDDDQRWVDDLRMSYAGDTKKSTAKQENAKRGVKGLPSSDAVLNCPACFTVLCLDCQKHELYQSQFRAMFVVNCVVDGTQRLKFPLKSNKKGKNKRKGKSGDATNAVPLNEDIDENYNPVKCEQCSTEVAVFDKDEVYHFFNVIDSPA